jgi:hypothetical protein
MRRATPIAETAPRTAGCAHTGNYSFPFRNILVLEPRWTAVCNGFARSEGVHRKGAGSKTNDSCIPSAVWSHRSTVGCSV